MNEPIPLFSEDPSKSSVIPVCLPWKEDDPGRALKEGDQLLNTGWGRKTNDQTSTEYGVSSRSLQSIKVPYVKNEKCWSKRQDVELCAGGKGKGNCIGDGGTPLVYRKTSGEPRYLVGLASIGPVPCGAPGTPDVYTKIVSFLGWIESKLEL